MVLFPARLMTLLTHWGRATHICVGKLTIIGSDNGLSPGRRQAIIWANVGILLIGPSRTNFSEILIENQTFSFKKMHLKMSSAKWRTFCLGLDVLHCQFSNISNRDYQCLNKHSFPEYLSDAIYTIHIMLIFRLRYSHHYPTPNPPKTNQHFG